MIQENIGLYTDELPALLDSLIILLKREIVIYRELQAAISHEKIILMKPSLERLLESNSKKETVILKAKMLEEGRLKLVKKIAKILDLEENEINLTVCVLMRILSKRKICRSASLYWADSSLTTGR